MKIAITGTHRVGKTTLAEKLQESLPDYQYIPEPYYELEEAGYEFSDMPGFDDYLAQLEHSIEQISSHGGNVIFDRSPVDILAYIHAIDESRNIQSLYHKVLDMMKEVDLLVFVPIEEPDLIVCSESDLPELRYQVNDILNDWIWDFEIETIGVSGTSSSRCKQVIDRINSLK